MLPAEGVRDAVEVQYFTEQSGADRNADDSAALSEVASNGLLAAVK